MIGTLSTYGKAALAIGQGIAASRVKLADTTTPEQREALQIARLRATSLRLPGQTLAQGRLSRGLANTVQAAQLGAASGSDLLGTVAAADRTRATGELQLNVQADQAQQGAQNALVSRLDIGSAQRQRDLQAYNQQKANLTGAAISNASNALDQRDAYAAYSENKEADAAYRAANPTASAASLSPTYQGLRGANTPGYYPLNDPTTGLGLRSGYYGTTRTRNRYPGLY